MTHTENIPLSASISGCTFLRNATELGFPFVESIQSILSIVDEFVVVVGKSRDDTLEKIKALQKDCPKIKIIETTWNDRMRDRGFVYAQQKMIGQFACTGDWVFYLEGDEVVHEKDLANIVNMCNSQLDNSKVEALVFDYHHFYGSPQWLASSPAWYRRECRIIRNSIRSYAPDGQYWLVTTQHRRPRKPQAVLANAHIYHYGHVRKVERMQEKLNQVSRYWNSAQAPKVDYSSIDPKALRSFQGTHPHCIQVWLETHAEHHFTPSTNRQMTSRERKHRISMMIEELTGLDLSKKHYKLI